MNPRFISKINNLRFASSRALIFIIYIAHANIGTKAKEIKRK